MFFLMNFPIKSIYLDKLQYFTNLNSSAIEGDDFPNINHDFQASGEQRGRDQIYLDLKIPDDEVNLGRQKIIPKFT